MESDEIKKVLLDIILEIDDELDTSNIVPEKPLRDQLDLDSMDFLDIVMALRKRYQIQVPEEDYPRLATLESAIAYLEPRLSP